MFMHWKSHCRKDVSYLQIDLYICLIKFQSKFQEVLCVCVCVCMENTKYHNFPADSRFTLRQTVMVFLVHSSRTCRK